MYRRLFFTSKATLKNNNSFAIKRISTSSVYKYGEDFNHVLKSLGSKFNIHQCDRILTAGEEIVSMANIDKSCPVKYIYLNHLTANSKVEDRWNVGLNQIDGNISSLLFGIVDGHLGSDCSNLLNRAALEYMGAALINPDKLKISIDAYKDISHYTIVRRFYPTKWESLHESLKEHFMTNLFNYMEEMLADQDRTVDPAIALKSALLRLDKDLFFPKDAENLENWYYSRPILRSSLSGAVALFARFYWLGKEGETNPTLHIANIGDCKAVLVKYDHEMKRLVGTPLNTTHDFSNPKEYERVIKEHPNDDPKQLIRDGRLLGELMPSRAFGDVRYKWPQKWIQDLDENVKLPGFLSRSPTPYTSPPYLSAEPEMFRYVLNPKVDKFIVFATDGLWDVLTPNQVAHIISSCPQVCSPATHLIKYALSGFSESNDIDVQKLSVHLALTPGVARHFRDDITVAVFKL